MSSNFPPKKPSIVPLLKPITTLTNDPSQAPINKTLRLTYAFPSVDPSKYISTVP